MIEGLPTREECIDLLRGSGCNESVIKHCLAVEELALKIAKLAHANEKLVSVGALLHDIGRGRTHGIRHAVEGAELARGLGLPEDVVLIIERHIEAGITENEARRIGLPPKDYIPLTLEEKIVAYADNLIEEDFKRPMKEIINLFEELGYKEAAKRIFDLHEELSEICETDLDLI
jgi:uncharacterized protein (TIGR00295 family)